MLCEIKLCEKVFYTCVITVGKKYCYYTDLRILAVNKRGLGPLLDCKKAMSRIYIALNTWALKRPWPKLCWTCF